MRNPTKRKLNRAVDAVDSDAPAPDVTVEWNTAGDPNPSDRGCHYDQETEMLTYDLWSAQRECLDALQSGEHDIVAFLGGYATGKSVLGARWLLAQALTHPDSRFLAMGQTFAEAENTTFRKLFAQLPGRQTASAPQRSPLVDTFTGSKHRLTLVNGAEIELGSANCWNRHAGAEFGAIWLDEPSHYEADLHELLEMMGTRLRSVAGPKIQCWTLTGNGYNDAWEILDQRQDTTGEPLGLQIELVRASTLENPYLMAEERDRLERQFCDTGREAQALHGEFAAAQGLVYPDFGRATHVIPDEVADDRVGDWRVYGYDYGWNAPTVLLELGKTGADQLVVCDEFHERQSHVEDVIAWLNHHDKPAGPIYCDHDPEHIAKFTREGYQATRATKDQDAGIAEVRKRLRADGSRPVRERTEQRRVVRRMSNTEHKERIKNSDQWTKDSKGGHRFTWSKTATSAPMEPTGDETADPGIVGLQVADSCKHLIREFFSYKEDHVGTTKATDHCLDALRYGCMGVAGQ